MTGRLTDQAAASKGKRTAWKKRSASYIRVIGCVFRDGLGQELPRSIAFLVSTVLSITLRLAALFAMYALVDTFAANEPTALVAAINARIPYSPIWIYIPTIFALLMFEGGLTYYSFRIMVRCIRRYHLWALKRFYGALQMATDNGVDLEVVDSSQGSASGLLAVGRGHTAMLSRVLLELMKMLRPVLMLLVSSALLIYLYPLLALALAIVGLALTASQVGISLRASYWNQEYNRLRGDINRANTRAIKRAIKGPGAVQSDALAAEHDLAAVTGSDESGSLHRFMKAAEMRILIIAESGLVTSVFASIVICLVLALYAYLVHTGATSAASIFIMLGIVINAGEATRGMFSGLTSLNRFYYVPRDFYQLIERLMKN